MDQTYRHLRFIILPACYVAFILLLIARSSIITSQEAEKYILAAKELQSGNYGPLVSKLFYSSYIIFLTACFMLGLKSVGVVVIQIFLQIISSWLIFETDLKLYRSKSAALILSILYLFNVPVQI